MATKWKDDPVTWEKMYHSNNTLKLEEFGYRNVTKSRIEVAEKPPVLQQLQGQITTFWDEFSSNRPAVRNNPKYSLRGTEDIAVDGDTLVVRVFESDYATVRFKNSRNDDLNRHLTAEQRDFLDNHYLTMGVGGYVRSEDSFLVGLRTDQDRGTRDGMLEYAPQGLVEPSNQKNDVLRNALGKELNEETGLGMGDFLCYTSTHLNIGQLFGDFTLIYGMDIKASSQGKERPSEEHARLEWKTSSELHGLINGNDRYILSPVTVALLEKLLRI